MAEATQDGLDKDATSDTKSNDNKHDNPKVNGYDAHHYTASRTASDPDAQEMLISSLRSQIQDLFSQVSGLNNKLVTSYDRVSDLEDSVHVASANLRSSNLKISQLELERTEHLSALNTGLLVEKSHVTSELNRLMEKATEEAAQRGQAESARAAIETELDDLSALLFGQANSMVAEARYAQHLSERKAEASERGFKGAEEAVQMMQKQMQALQADKEEADLKVEEMEMTMGKGKWLEKRNSANSSSSIVTIRLMSSHTPYQEFLMFVANLRTIHPSTPQPPAMTTLLTSPFLVRLVNEDSEPTVRLDFAPSLNWLTRRSVLSAIHAGQLTIEPMSSNTLLQESSYSMSTSIPGLNNGNTSPSCALCGTPIFSTLEVNQSRSPSGAMTHTNSGSMTSWGTALFKKPSTNPMSRTNSQPPTPPHSIGRTHSLPSPPQIHIFRLATQSTSQPHNSEPSASQLGVSQSQSSTIYPLCTNGWCLARLRSTCTLWAFVRTGIVEKVWDEEISNIPPPMITPAATNGEKPPVPPRRRGLWGMASALGERAANWSEGDKDKGKKVSPQPIRTPSDSSSPAPTPPPPPPRASYEKRRLPPPPTHPSVAAAHSPIKHAVPPPLPKRSEVRRPPATTSTSTQTRLVPTPPEVASNDVEHSPSDTPAVTAPSTPAQSPPPPPQRSPHRPSTPANIPLPESRPHTPPVVVRPTTPMTTPPPLPRRAAARGSRLIADGLPRPRTPLASGLGTGPVPTKVEDDAKRHGDESALHKDEPVRAVEGEIREERGDEVVEPVNAELEPPVEKEVVDGKSDDEGAKKQVVPVAASSSSLPSTAETDKGTPDEDEQAADAEFAMNEDVLDEMEKQKIVDGNDKDWEEVQAEEAITAVNGDKNNEDQDTRSVEVKDPKMYDGNEAFVGDATWEERTWKELVRLREEMFWARIGALRQ